MSKLMFILPLFMCAQSLQSSSLMPHAFKNTFKKPIVRTFFTKKTSDWQQAVEEYDALTLSLAASNPTVTQKRESLNTSRKYQKYMNDGDYNSHYKLSLAAKSLVRFSEDAADQDLAARMISFYVEQIGIQEEKQKALNLIPEFQRYMHPKLSKFFKFVESYPRQTDPVRFHTLHSFIKIGYPSDFRDTFKRLLDASYHDKSEEFLTDYASIASDLVLYNPFPEYKIDTISSLKAFITINQKTHGHNKGFLDCIQPLLLLHADDSQAKYVLKKPFKIFHITKKGLQLFSHHIPCIFHWRKNMQKFLKQGNMITENLRLKFMKSLEAKTSSYNVR